MPRAGRKTFVKNLGQGIEISPGVSPDVSSFPECGGFFDDLG